jgi:hypothetical protein
MLSGKATNTNFIVFGFTRSWLEPTIYRARGEHANHYATMRLYRESQAVIQIVANNKTKPAQICFHSYVLLVFLRQKYIGLIQYPFLLPYLALSSSTPTTGTWGHNLHYPPPPFFLFMQFFFHTLLNIILVSNSHKSIISFSLFWFLYQFLPFYYQTIFTF